MSERYDLAKLRTTTDWICRQADPADFDEAINWGDIGCRESEYYENEHQSGHRVVVDEASPDAGDFCAWICGELSDAGYPDVEVITEW